MKTTSLLSMLFACGLVAAPATSSFASPSTPAARPDYRSMKYGFFVHYVWGGDAYSVTVNKDGSKPAGLDDVADRFDAAGFADDLASMGVEYVLFTAWHANQNVLYPSKVMDKWLPGHSSKRDLIGDMIKACKAKGIHVLLYTHPRDGHDFNAQDQARTGWAAGKGSDPDWEKFDKAKWNDFINEVYAELVDRYGNDILGLYLDEGSGAADSYRVVDYPRLRKTITGKHPHLLMMQNNYGNLYTADVGNMEIFHNHSFGTPDGDQWQSYQIPISIVTGSIFWAAFPKGETEPSQKSDKVGFNKWIHHSPEALFRYTVLQAGANRDGGGVLWAAGPYPGGGWESGVLERMQATGKLIAPVSQSIKNTRPSTSWITKPGARIADLDWGVATTSTDNRTEFLHVLKPPSGTTRLSLPPPADGKRFSSARLLPDGSPVAMKQSPTGVEVHLPTGTTWSNLNTIIALEIAADSPAPDLALWRGGRASSHLDNARHPSMATDGNEATVWESGDGDASPWFGVDLARPARADRIELLGNVTRGDVLQFADDHGFANPKELPLPAADQPVLVIVRASYGKENHSADVTGALRAIASGSGLRVTAGNDLSGNDPAPNVPKELRVDYTLDGKASTVTVPEGQSLEIGNLKPMVIDVPGDLLFQHVRVVRKDARPPLRVNEFRVFGHHP